MKMWNKKSLSQSKLDEFIIGKDRYYDLFLTQYDCKASIAHVRMLETIGVYNKNESKKVILELKKIILDSKKENFILEDKFEDIHSKIEFIITEKYGDLGKKIHTGRSRNDQVLVAIQLYLKKELNEIKYLTKDLFDILLNLALINKNNLMPGYTHFQSAMPSSFGLWFSAYAESLIDDIEIINSAHFIVDQNPLGSAAGYGSSIPIDRLQTTKDREFNELKYNSLSSQMSREKIGISTSNAISSLPNTLSRFSTDICLYMSQEFNFISFPNELTTGSSIMPHKKNPDIFEILRGRCNILKNLPSKLNILSSNLPSGYHRDMQLSKEIIIDGILEIKEYLKIFAECIKKIKIKKNILNNSKYDHIFSVDSINKYLQNGIPFRDAYHMLKDDIKSKKYKPYKKIKHTHIGSIGNLCLNKIKKKMEKTLIKRDEKL